MRLTGFKLRLKDQLSNITAYPLRACLSLLGILFGTGSIVALIAASSMASHKALAQFTNLGADITVVNLFDRNKDSMPTTLEHIQTLQATLARVTSAAPYMPAPGNAYVNGIKLTHQVVAATPALFPIMNIEIERGRYLTPLDAESSFALIGHDLAEQLKQQGIFSPIGEQVEIQNTLFTIAGVLAPWKSHPFFCCEVDKSVIIPFEQVGLFSDQADVKSVILKLSTTKNIHETINAIHQSLYQIKPDKRTFVRSAQQIIESRAEQTKIFRWLLFAVGGIALLVGGIGIMNMMLVSVTLRRQEIGLRKALGARRRDIALLFLTESVLMTAAGCILGVLAGAGVAYVFSRVLNWTFLLPLNAVFIAMGTALLIGIGFGCWPAMRAAKLDPIQALRSA